MNVGKACHQCVRFSLVWAFTVLFVLSLLVAGILIRLYYKPYDLAEYMPAVHEILYVEKTGGIRFDNLVLSFDGRLNLEGEGVLVLGPGQKMMATARSLRLELSHRSLLAGVLAFKVLEFDGLGVRFVHTDSKTQVGQYELPKGAGVAKPDIEKILEKLRKQRALKFIEVVNFKNTMAHFTLASGEETFRWDAANTDLLFTQSKNLGVHAELTGVLKRQTYTTSFHGTFEHPAESKSARLQAKIGALESRIFQPLLPEGLQNKLDAAFEGIDLRAKLDDTYRLKEVTLSTRLGTSLFKLPEVYPDGVHIRSANVGVNYTVETRKFQLLDFVVEDAQGLLLSGSGEVEIPPGTDAVIADTVFSINEAKIQQILTYLPPEHTHELISWFKKATNYSEANLKGINLNIKGDLRQFPFDYAEANENVGLMEVHFDYNNLDMEMHENLPVLKNLKGEAVLQGDVMRIVSKEGGMLADQHMKDIDVIISDIIRSENSPTLRGTGVVTGSANSMLPLVASLFDTQPILEEMQGEQVSKVDIVFPLGGDEEDLQFSVKTEVTDTSFNLPHIEKPFQTQKLSVETTDQKLTLKSEGQVSLLADQTVRWPATILWQENMQNVGRETYVEATLTTTGNPAPDVLANLKADVIGEIVHSFRVKRSENAPDWFNVTLTSALKDAALEIKSFEWQKAAGEEAEFQAEGQLREDGRVFDAEMLLFKAPEAEIMGAAYFKFDDSMKAEEFTLNLAPFKLGQTDANIIYQDEDFSLTGKNFNFTGVGKGRLHEDMKIADGRYEVELEKLTFKGGKFFDMNGFLLRENGVWDSAHLNAKIGEEKRDFTLLLADAEREEDSVEKPAKNLEIYAGDAGDALRALGVYDNIYKGKMEAFLRIHKEYSAFGFDAEGHLLIENSFIRNAPAMVRLLSLVSLEQIMSAGQGIAFEEIRFPLQMQNRTLYIEKGRMKGPNIAMRLAGSFDFQKDEIELDGSLTPASGINSVISKIPLIGAIITGTQGAVMVADFGISGSMAEPRVWANPLSIVTPGLLKDIFGGIFGSQTPKPKKVTPPEIPETLNKEEGKTDGNENIQKN